MQDIDFDQNLKKYIKWQKINVISSVLNAVYFITYYVFILIRELSGLDITDTFKKVFYWVLIVLWAPDIVMFIIGSVKAHKYKKCIIESGENTDEDDQDQDQDQDQNQDGE